MSDSYFKALALSLAGTALIISCTTLIVVYIIYREDVNGLLKALHLKKKDASDG